MGLVSSAPVQAAVSFALTDLPGVVALYDASSLSALADGASVRRLGDLSGLGHDAVQFTTANQPTKQTGPDGKAVVRFSTNQLLACATFGNGWPLGGAIAQPLTFMVVAKTSSSQTGTPLLVGGTGTGGLSRVLIDSTKHALFGLANGTGTSVIGPNLADDTWHVLTVVLDSASATVYVDGILIVANTTQIQGADGLKTLTLGALSVGNNQWLADVADVVICNARLTPKQIEKASTFLAAKHGLNAGLCSAPVAWETTTDANATAVRVFTPPNVAASKTLILWSHPASQNEQVGPNYWAYAYAHAAVNNGWYFAASNMHGDSWGNAQSQTDLAALYALMASRDNFNRIILAGASMGGLASANAIAMGTVPSVAGAYLIDPALSLSAMFAGNAGTYSASIRTAYGIAADGTDYSTKTTGYDPALVPGASYPIIRWRFLASTSDTNVSKANNADVFQPVAAVKGIESGVVTHLGPHLDGGAINPADFVAFVKRCGG